MKDKDKNKRSIVFELNGTKKNIVITVSDSGHGIQKDIADNIFLPFFTTKGGNGIGLGLTIVRDTIRKYQGNIIPIIPGNIGGATFEISLPVIRKEDVI
jgi:C4-dicarboxylate-specific signal transduction histidine kinase